MAAAAAELTVASGHAHPAQKLLVPAPHSVLEPRMPHGAPAAARRGRTVIRAKGSVVPNFRRKIWIERCGLVC